MSWKTPIGEARTNLHARRYQEAQAQARLIAELALQTDCPMRVTSPRAAGDPHALRGIPVVGVKGGIGGAMPGTKPDRLRT